MMVGRVRVWGCGGGGEAGASCLAGGSKRAMPITSGVDPALESGGRRRAKRGGGEMVSI